ncbi:MAG: hypothetical protein Q4G33_07090 [bacterium]|nr:hypothetical protein [bacterium]
MKKYIPIITTVKQLNKRNRIVLFAVCGLIINVVYAFYNGILGIISHSVWFITLFAYYIVLSAMRFSTVIVECRNISKDNNTEIFIMKFCGVLLIVLALILSGATCISIMKNIAVKHQESIMITIAAYTFYKIILTIVNTVKIKKENSPLLSTIRNISCADAAVSLLSMQRSMLVSFEGKSADEIRIMNALTGAAVFLFIVLLGMSMILRKSERNH